MSNPLGKALILASNSPRRKALLALGGRDFEVRPADVDESVQAGESPQAYVQRLAVEKAQKVAENLDSGLVLAADTTVADEGRILGKPEDAEAAREMLSSMRGKRHTVYTGLALLDAESGEVLGDLAISEVPMRDYGDEEMEAYIASGDPFDKAGAYAIQHEGFHPVENLKQCYANVVGLPLCHVQRNLDKLAQGFDVDIAAACQTHLGYECPVYAEVLNWEQ